MEFPSRRSLSSREGRPSESKTVTVRPHVIELDVDGASVWIWRDAEIEMVTAIIDALRAGS